jgi:hypothetical protein
MAYTVGIGLGLAPRIMFPECFAVEIRGFFVLLGSFGGKIGVTIRLNDK